MQNEYPVGPLFLYPRIVFNSAFVGWGRRPGDATAIAIYDFALCVDAVRQWYSMDPEDAHDYVTTQCEGAWLGPGTPLIMQVGTPGQLEELL
jgi:hypothetical protein